MEQEQQAQEEKGTEEEPRFWYHLGKAALVGFGAGLLGFAAGIGFHAAQAMVSKNK